MLNNHFTLTFLSNKYSKCYYNIVKNALQANRKKLPKNNKNFVYYESHHIIPKSIKPDFKDLKLNLWNKALLTPKEHFICHLLLTKMLSGPDKNKMVYALWGMTNQASKYQGKRFKSNMYAAYKIKMQNALSSERKGKTFEQLYGKQKADEIKSKMKGRKTRGTPSIEEKAEIGQRFKKYYKENPGKAGFASKPQLDKVTCECCGILVDPGNYARHHGEKCKRVSKICPTCNSTFSSVPWENKKYCCKKCYHLPKQDLQKDASAYSS